MRNVRLTERRPLRELKCEVLRPPHDVASCMAPHHEKKDQRMFTSAIFIQDAQGQCKAPIDDVLI